MPHIAFQRPCFCNAKCGISGCENGVFASPKPWFCNVLNINLLHEATKIGREPLSPRPTYINNVYAKML